MASQANRRNARAKTDANRTQTGRKSDANRMSKVRVGAMAGWCEGREILEILRFLSIFVLAATE